MMFRSVRGGGRPASFRDALFRGIAEDGGLFVPESIPRLSDTFLEGLGSRSLHEIGVEILSHYIDDVSMPDLRGIVQDAWNFPIPVVDLEPGIHLLELFHGPTLAFKDVGARFMARILSHYLDRDSREVTILVATSGDTGSAVAAGFHDVPRVTVYVLYPSGRISPLQEKQIATLGGNIHALEVEGTFDDCQRMVKEALGDAELRQVRDLTTANSINVGRLLPQIAYYGWAAAQLLKADADPPRAAGPISEGLPGAAAQPNANAERRPRAPHVVVPSGNFGNLTAAVYAREMGIPLHSCAAATNANDVVPEYFRSGIFRPRDSIATMSNAMDVGNPSNLARLEALFGHDLEKLRGEIPAVSVSDAETAEEMRRVHAETGRIIDPHTAVGVAGARRLQATRKDDRPIIVPSTAHPGKFPEIIERILGIRLPMPSQLEAALHRQKQSVAISASFTDLKDRLLA